MIWIGTSGWIYPHWVGRFYPSDLPIREHLAYYARHFATVEINNSFYRLPSYDQFHCWSEQVQFQPNFCFAVKASRYITHLKKLQRTEEGVARLYNAATGLGTHLGPLLYQLPPHWHANIERLKHFILQLPDNHRAAFELRDPTWFQEETLQALRQFFDETGCALVMAVGGSSPTPPDIPSTGSFDYIRFHGGAQGIGFTNNELETWAERLRAAHTKGREVFVYFNNDAEGYAISNAQQLQNLLKDLLPGAGDSC
ncbi:MAG TPA: DUF72 domain-containing protein [Ktedonobacteraceae bacterium]|jgi:uncharacterized protein YecE (DUF72 family)